ncbi:MAG: hypothetical protein K0R71_2191 [Bacillales bacterium]|jgi:uncharacterized membrane protein YuzA (DUF378 family)|nr:hypothetical protein [Bacillales bacterium]
MKTLQRIALTLVIIGAINWGLIGLFNFDLVAAIFGGQEAFLSELIYSLVGLSGLICLTLLFKQWDPSTEGETNNKGTYGKLNYGTEFGEETNTNMSNMSSMSNVNNPVNNPVKKDQ